MQKRTDRNAPVAGSGLRLRGPILLAGTVVFAAAGVGLAAASLQTDTSRIVLSGSVTADREVIPLKSLRSGSIAGLFAATGQQVKAGQTIVTLETRDVDLVISQLKEQCESAKRQLDRVRTEASKMSELVARNLALRDDVDSLEAHLAALERDASMLDERLGRAEQDLARSTITAPADGRVTLAQRIEKGQRVDQDATIIEFLPDEDRIVLEAAAPESVAAALSVPARVDVRLGLQAWHDRRLISGQLTSVSRARGGETVVRVMLDPPRADFPAHYTSKPGDAAKILIGKPRTTFFGQFLAPAGLFPAAFASFR